MDLRIGDSVQILSTGAAQNSWVPGTVQDIFLEAGRVRTRVEYVVAGQLYAKTTSATSKRIRKGRRNSTAPKNIVPGRSQSAEPYNRNRQRDDTAVDKQDSRPAWCTNAAPRMPVFPRSRSFGDDDGPPATHTGFLSSEQETDPQMFWKPKKRYNGRGKYARPWWQ